MYEVPLDYARVSIDTVLGAFAAGTHALTCLNEGKVFATPHRAGERVSPHDVFGSALAQNILRNIVGGGSHVDHVQDPGAEQLVDWAEGHAREAYISESLEASIPPITFVPELA